MTTHRSTVCVNSTLLLFMLLSITVIATIIITISSGVNGDDGDDGNNDNRADGSITWYNCANTDANPFPNFNPYDSNSNDDNARQDHDKLSDESLVDLLLQATTAAGHNIKSNNGDNGNRRKKKKTDDEKGGMLHDMTRSLVSVVMGNQWTRTALMKLTDGAAHLEHVRAQIAAHSELTENVHTSHIPLNDNNAITRARGKVGMREAKCAKVSVPLLWNEREDERMVEFFVKKFSADPTKRKGQLWMLQGGPGVSGEAFDVLAPVLGAMLDWEYDIIVPDHRGSGRSTLFKCDPMEVAMPHMHKGDIQKCYEQLLKTWPDGGMKGFSTTNAARDVLHVMNLIKQENDGEESDMINLYGVSYGTYLVNRVLQLDRLKLVNRVIVDSMVSPGTFDFIQWDQNYNSVGLSYLQRCDINPFCKGKFEGLKKIRGKDGNDEEEEDEVTAQSAMRKFYEKITSKDACYAPSDTTTVRRALSSYLADPDFREFIIPLVYREHRCSSKDKVIMDNWNLALRVIKFLTPIAAKGPYREKAPTSYPLMRYIGSNELSKHNSVNEEYVKENLNIALFADGVGYMFWNATEVVHDMGINYEEELKDKFGVYTGPLLMLHGDLDPQANLDQARKWKERFEDDDDHWIEFPNGQHATILNSITTDGTPCALKIVADFIRNPEDRPDTSCIDDTLDKRMDFTGTNRTVALKWFGGDLWEGGPLLSTRTWLKLVAAVSVAVALLVSCLLFACCITCITCIVRRRRAASKVNMFHGVKYSQIDTEVPYDV